MFGFFTLEFLVVALAALSVGGFVFGILYPFFFSSGVSSNRLKKVSGKDGGKSDKVGASKLDQMMRSNRRKQVQDALKQVERDSNKARQSRSLQMQLAQSGVQMTPSAFWVMSGILGVIGFIFSYIFIGNIIISVLIAIVCFFGLPRFWLRRKRRKFLDQFLTELPNAIDIMSRGVKSGLGIKECIGMVAEESSYPVRDEFAELIDAQKLGLTFEQGLGRVYERTLLPEINFLKIVISLQESSGGQLSEVLENLSSVLRDRHKMKAKIRAFSQESRTSAMVIGALPPLLAFGMFLMRPELIEGMLDSPIGQLLFFGSGIWMCVGFFVMNRMTKFDF